MGEKQQMVVLENYFSFHKNKQKILQYITYLQEIESLGLYVSMLFFCKIRWHFSVSIFYIFIHFYF